MLEDIRIVKAGPRRGDGAEVAILQLHINKKNVKKGIFLFDL